MPKSEAHTNFDQLAFEQLFKSHFAHLCNFAYQFVPDMDSAKDITQKVFILLWENRENINPDQSIKSYLFTAVKNRCLNHIRDQKKYRSRILDVDIHDIDISFEEDQMAVDELEGKVARALSQLPEKCRQVFEMSRYQNKKYQDIATALDISVKTVEAHMSRALKGLRADLKDYLYFLILMMSHYFL